MASFVTVVSFVYSRLLYNIGLHIRTCDETGCSCDNYREELLQASNAMIIAGNCINCAHPANKHLRSLTGIFT